MRMVELILKKMHGRLHFLSVVKNIGKVSSLELYVYEEQSFLEPLLNLLFLFFFSRDSKDSDCLQVWCEQGDNSFGMRSAVVDHGKPSYEIFLEAVNSYKMEQLMSKNMMYLARKSLSKAQRRNEV